jgi:hypothetical protein
LVRLRAREPLRHTSILRARFDSERRFWGIGIGVVVVGQEVALPDRTSESTVVAVASYLLGAKFQSKSPDGRDQLRSVHRAAATEVLNWATDLEAAFEQSETSVTIIAGILPDADYQPTGLTDVMEHVGPDPSTPRPLSLVNGEDRFCITQDGRQMHTFRKQVWLPRG